MHEYYDDAVGTLWELNNNIHLLSINLHQLDENLNLAPDDREKFEEYKQDLVALTSKYCQ